MRGVVEGVVGYGQHDLLAILCLVSEVEVGWAVRNVVLLQKQGLQSGRRQR